MEEAGSTDLDVGLQAVFPDVVQCHGPVVTIDQVECRGTGNGECADKPGCIDTDALSEIRAWRPDIESVAIICISEIE